MFGLFFISCNDPIPTESVKTIDTLPLETPLLLRRISLDIRGTLPTLEEQNEFLEHGEDIIIDQFLEDENSF